ncbi:MAG: hypothetical protein WB952_09550 [Terriglobales bacterium]
MFRRISLVFSIMGLLLTLGSIAGAQSVSAEKARTLGSAESGFLPAAVNRPTVDIFLTTSWTNASYGTGGVALRNRRVGSLNVGGVTAPTKAAYVYWAVLLNTKPGKSKLKSISTVTVARQFPTGGTTSATVTGTLLAVGGDPCWASIGTWVYRASVPTSVANGSGLYKVSFGTPVSGLSDGEDPWDGNVVFPLLEGASLVIVGTGGATVGLLDGQAGTTFIADAGYQNFYQLPATIGSFGSQVLLDNIGYDGQIGNSRLATTSNETTNIEGWPSLTNNILVAGPGGETGNSDWDGSIGGPLPQLWDDTGHDVSNAFLANDTWALVSYGGGGSDCVGTVAAVMSVQ